MGNGKASKIVRRPIERTIFVPFEDGDAALTEYAQEIHDKTIAVARITLEIDALKEQRKGPQSDLDAAIEAIGKGKPIQVVCTEILDYDEGRVVVIRNDTKEQLTCREMEDADFQGQIGDEEGEAAE